MEKLKLALKSRTVWTVVAMFVVNGVSGIQSIIPVDWLPFVNAALGLLAAYFRVSPRV